MSGKSGRDIENFVRGRAGVVALFCLRILSIAKVNTEKGGLLQGSVLGFV